MEQSFPILCHSPTVIWIPSCKYKASWLMATSAEFNILPAYTPSHFLCLLCKELWVLGERSINKCIVRVTLRGGYSNNFIFLKGEGSCLFHGGSGPHYWCELSTLLLPVPHSYFLSSTLSPHFFFFLHLSSSTHRGNPEVCLVRIIWPSSLFLVQCKYSWSVKSWWIWAIW